MISERARKLAVLGGFRDEMVKEAVLGTLALASIPLAANAALKKTYHATETFGQPVKLRLGPLGTYSTASPIASPFGGVSYGGQAY